MVLLLVNSIVLSSQTLTDTVRCYTRSQLIKIASKLEKGKECDTLLKISQLQINLKDNIIANDSTEIKYYTNISCKKEFIIQSKDIQIEDLKYDLEKNQKKLKWVESGWIGTTVIILTLLILK